MADPVDSTMILRVLQTVQSIVTRLELKISDLDDKISRVLDEQYIHRGQISELRHDTRLLNDRYRDLEARMRALEESYGGRKDG